MAAGELAVGPVAAGETVRVPFRLDGPPTLVRPFRGELVGLEYTPSARVDLPWAFDETAEVVAPVG